MTSMVTVTGYYGGVGSTRVCVRDADENGGWITKKAYKGALRRLDLSVDHYQTLKVVGQARGYTITVEPNVAIIK